MNMTACYADSFRVSAAVSVLVEWKGMDSSDVLLDALFQTDAISRDGKRSVFHCSKVN